MSLEYCRYLKRLGFATHMIGKWQYVQQITDVLPPSQESHY